MLNIKKFSRGVNNNEAPFFKHFCTFCNYNLSTLFKKTKGIIYTKFNKLIVFKH